ncbi:hypothetical protein M427DRAFT_440732 [Gonapodya prolifera JEL478]|uniref:Uncharacterized protein n=1 Tax=Gonapodya prolifera (strain JEL478) TaxID=1344416 RepID=A0A139A388_GONPJ|nr:hypothetical protein M427DRAFT_440732 [Gonapodya prolifera JEL478]|eukprot:KXS11277.1 hypothetical protein M427DRAFT_440732 [Gonapodya prolifera JEL478]
MFLWFRHIWYLRNPLRVIKGQTRPPLLKQHLNCNLSSPCQCVDQRLVIARVDISTPIKQTENDFTPPIVEACVPKTSIVMRMNVSTTIQQKLHCFQSKQATCSGAGCDVAICVDVSTSFQEEVDDVSTTIQHMTNSWLGSPIP